MADNSVLIEFVKNKTNDLQSDLESALADLEAAAAASITFSAVQSAFDNNADWDVTDLAPLSTPNTDDLSGMPRLVIPPFAFNPEDYFSSDLVQRFSYQSDFFDNFLDSRLRTYIDSQGYFLAQSVQDALFEQMRQRDLQTLNDALDAVERMHARRGFPMPTSMLMAARNEVIKKYQDTYNDRNKEITALIADKSLQEKMHAMDTGVKMEDIRSRFQLEFARLYWQAADYLIRKYEADVRALIAKFQGELDILKLHAAVDEKNLDVDVEQERMRQAKELARFQMIANEIQANLQGWQTSVRLAVQAAERAVVYYGSAVAGVTGMVNAVDYNDVGAQA